MTLKHTPTPWYRDRKSRIGGRFDTDDQSNGMMDAVLELEYENRDANAEFILKAVNSHNDLVNAINALIALPEVHDDWAITQWAKGILNKAEGNL